MRFLFLILVSVLYICDLTGQGTVGAKYKPKSDTKWFDHPLVGIYRNTPAFILNDAELLTPHVFFADFLVTDVDGSNEAMHWIYSGIDTNKKSTLALTSQESQLSLSTYGSTHNQPIGGYITSGVSSIVSGNDLFLGTNESSSAMYFMINDSTKLILSDTNYFQIKTRLKDFSGSYGNHRSIYGSDESSNPKWKDVDYAFQIPNSFFQDSLFPSELEVQKFVTDSLNPSGIYDALLYTVESPNNITEAYGISAGYTEIEFPSPNNNTASLEINNVEILSNFTYTNGSGNVLVTVQYLKDTINNYLSSVGLDTVNFDVGDFELSEQYFFFDFAATGSDTITIIGLSPQGTPGHQPAWLDYSSVEQVITTTGSSRFYPDHVFRLIDNKLTSIYHRLNLGRIWYIDPNLPLYKRPFAQIGNPNRGFRNDQDLFLFKGNEIQDGDIIYFKAGIHTGNYQITRGNVTYHFEEGARLNTTAGNLYKINITDGDLNITGKGRFSNPTRMRFRLNPPLPTKDYECKINAELFENTVVELNNLESDDNYINIQTCKLLGNGIPQAVTTFNGSSFSNQPDSGKIIVNVGYYKNYRSPITALRRAGGTIVANVDIYDYVDPNNQFDSNVFYYMNGSSTNRGLKNTSYILNIYRLNVPDVTVPLFSFGDNSPSTNSNNSFRFNVQEAVINMSTVQNFLNIGKCGPGNRVHFNFDNCQILNQGSFDFVAGSDDIDEYIISGNYKTFIPLMNLGTTDSEVIRFRGSYRTQTFGILLNNTTANLSLENARLINDGFTSFLTSASSVNIAVHNTISNATTGNANITEVGQSITRNSIYK